MGFNIWIVATQFSDSMINKKVGGGRGGGEREEGAQGIRQNSNKMVEGREGV